MVLTLAVRFVHFTHNLKFTIEIMYKISHENNPDIILVKDLLPSKIISKIWVDLEKLKPFFGHPHWTKRQLNPIDKCQGEDIWLHHPFKKNIPELKGIKLLDKFFFIRGLRIIL